jgi:hypothetical protein
MKRTLVAGFVSALVVIIACTATRFSRRTVGETCTSTRQDCAYGLECRVPQANEIRPSLFDGGALPEDAGAAIAGALASQGGTEADGGVIKRCEYAVFNDCSEDPTGPQCLSGQRCRDGKCTVMCASDAECGPNAQCKIGVCQRTRSQLTQCYDNRDCPWPESCFHGQCVVRTEAFRCNSDLDCPTAYGYRCINGRCQ